MEKTFELTEGASFPLGSVAEKDGVNFAVFSSNATKVELCLFFEENSEELVFPMIRDEKNNVWHLFVKDLKAGQLYGFRAYGEYAPYIGRKFNPNKLLVDPYAKLLKGEARWHDSMYPYLLKEPISLMSFSSDDSSNFVPKSVVVEDDFDWQDDKRPLVPMQDTIIYEMNVKAMTALNSEVPLAYRGKFLGLSQPAMIRYFKDLGITSLELLPVQNFFTNSILLSKGLSNFWGYDSLCFFAPHNDYLVKDDVAEFKQMVKDLHKAGLEVILDIALNHTTESNAYGPMLSYKGLDNEIYYKPDPQNPIAYIDETGCGASFNVNHPDVLRLVLDVLRYWAMEMHVDGFRFDLASVLGRTKNGFDADAPFFKEIAKDENLKHLKLIVEPWDLGHNGYRLGQFPAGFMEWNDKYRDAVRKFWRGDKGSIIELARRVSGSKDIFGNRHCYDSVNFVTAHDGFTLYDLVSYDYKHNLANGENNHDGTDYNWSWNSGVEGETDDKDVINLRQKRMKAIVATLMLSAGTPMILYGDEMSRTKNGNNNTYCHDNEMTWLQWQKDWRKDDFWRFVSFIINFRKRHNIFDFAKFTAFTPDAKEMGLDDWLLPYPRSISYVATGKYSSLFVILNAYDGDIEWLLPRFSDDKGRWINWELVFDTANFKNGDTQHKIFERYKAPAWSVVCFEGE